MDRYCQFAVAAAKRAVEQAGLDPRGEGLRAAVSIGSGVGGLHTLLQGHRALLERGPGRVSPTLVPMMMANSAAAQVSIHFGARGRALSPASACATGTDAIGEAFRMIRRGDADVALAGGAEAAVTELTLAAFGNATALSTRNDAPERASRPFDAERDGFVVAEGAGVLVLESEAHARQRGARILAEVAGYGATSDAHHIVAPEPEGVGAADAVREALADARMGPEDVDCISAHATSTPAGDLAEARAIRRVFGRRADRVPIIAIKSMLGHMLGAAGAVAAVALVRTLLEGVLPPVLNLEHPDPECDLDLVMGRARQTGGLHVGLSNSFGFGGHNSVLVLRRFEP